jgi:hypothetical protein
VWGCVGVWVSLLWFSQGRKGEGGREGDGGERNLLDDSQWSLINRMTCADLRVCGLWVRSRSLAANHAGGSGGTRFMINRMTGEPILPAQTANQ